MEDLAMAVDLEGAQNEAKGATNRQVAEDNQNTARVEQNPKKEVKVADSPDGAAEVVMEDPDGAEVGAKTLGPHGLQVEVMEDLHGAQGQHGAIVEAGIITNDKKPKKRNRRTRQANKQRGAGRRRNADNQSDS